VGRGRDCIIPFLYPQGVLRRGAVTEAEEGGKEGQGILVINTKSVGK